MYARVDISLIFNSFFSSSHPFLRTKNKVYQALTEIGLQMSQSQEKDGTEK